jgi:hypothetical protein
VSFPVSFEKERHRNGYPQRRLCFSRQWGSLVPRDYGSGFNRQAKDKTEAKQLLQELAQQLGAEGNKKDRPSEIALFPDFDVLYSTSEPLYQIRKRP